MDPEHGRHQEDEAGGNRLEGDLHRKPERAAEHRVVEDSQVPVEQVLARHGALQAELHDRVDREEEERPEEGQEQVPEREPGCEVAAGDAEPGARRAVT